MSTQSQANLTLADCVNVASVESLSAELKALLTSKAPVVIDATGVVQADTAALQLLCSFVRTVRTQELGFEWVGVSEVLRETAETLGLSNELELGEA